ncbi:MAG: S8 family serine peptidase, partial [Acidobacteriota bacterium]
MNKVRLFLLIVLIGFSLLVPSALWKSSKAQNSYVEGELLVKFKKDSSPGEMHQAHNQVGAIVVKEFPLIEWQQVRLPAGMSVQEAITDYSALAAVESVQPNYSYKLLLTPNDARFSELYGMTKIQAPTAWNTTTGSSSIVVAVIDTGVFYTHEDLAPNMWHNPGEITGNNIDDDGNGYVDDVFGIDVANSDANPLDDHGHGTHVSGTIGGKGNNSVGVTGVNWSVSIMALKLHDATGFATAAGAIECFQYITMMKNNGINIRVSSNSWGGPNEAPGYDQALKDAIDAAGNAGILNVFAAGNDNNNNDVNPFYPASYNSPNVLAVASSNSSDTKPGFSNYGLVTVDLAAPGSSILSTIIGTSSYGFLSGTSMACPHVSGSAALVAAQNPTLSNVSLKATLLNNVDLLPQWSGIVRSGGRLNVAKAMTSPTVCSFALAQTSQDFTAAGGNGSVSITAPNNCDWAVVSNASFISVTSGEVGSSNGSVNFTVAANPNTTPRTGTIKIAGQTFTVNQAAASGCTFSINPTSQNFSASGGNGTVNVTAGAGCNWTATSNAAFITVTTGGSGSGNGTVNYTVAANSSTSSRTGTITIAGQTFTVNQSGATVTCSFILTPTSDALPA